MSMVALVSKVVSISNETMLLVVALILLCNSVTTNKAMINRKLFILECHSDHYSFQEMNAILNIIHLL